MKTTYESAPETPAKQFKGAGLTECLFCGAEITPVEKGKRGISDFCDSDCEANYYGYDE